MIKSFFSHIQNKINAIEMKTTDLLLPFFGMLFIAAHIGTNIYAARLISFNIFGLDLTVGGGIFIFPLTFFILDTVTEYYGATKAILLVIFNIITLGVLCVGFFYTQSIPTNNSNIINEHYKLVSHPFIRAFFATSLSGIVGYIFNILFLDKMREKFGTGGKVMFYRLLFVTAFAEIIYSFVWVSVDMIGNVDMHRFSQIVGSNFIVKIVFQMLSIPFTIAIVRVLNKIDNRETLKVENPFINENYDNLNFTEIDVQNQ